MFKIILRMYASGFISPKQTTMGQPRQPVMLATFHSEVRVTKRSDMTLFTLSFLFFLHQATPKSLFAVSACSRLSRVFLGGLGLKINQPPLPPPPTRIVDDGHGPLLFAVLGYDTSRYLILPICNEALTLPIRGEVVPPIQPDWVEIIAIGNCWISGT